MNAASEVFAVPELVELILLSLPSDNVHQEINSIRTILLSQTTCRTWHLLLQESTPIRKRLYLPTRADTTESQTWHTKHAFPPAQPNPWIPDLLLSQRSWGSAWPFDAQVYQQGGLQGSEPRHWIFSFEISRAQYTRLPKSGAWRDMLLSSPPFTDCWYTRCFYELGSGRAPFVTHVDYNPRLPKSEQKYRVHCASGITLGHVCDAVSELFEKHSTAKFVMVESVRLASEGGGKIELSEDRPLTKTYIPGMSAEKAHGWHRGL